MNPSNDLRSILAQLTLQSLRLRFFDLDVIIQSDSTPYVDLFDQMYRRFRTNPTLPPARTHLEFVVLTQPVAPWGQPVLLINGQAQTLPTPALLEGYVYENILHTIIAQVQSHFLIHAGVVADQDQGIIIAGDTGHGKTTLILELVRRGFKFLSDEMAALGRMDRRVYPFPRSLRIRPGTLERVGFAQAAVGATVWLNKLILDIEQIQPNSMGAPVPVQHIVILRNPADTHPHESGTARMIHILVDRVDDAFLTALCGVEGIMDVDTIHEPGYAVLKIRAAFPTQILPRVEAVCRAHHVLIFEVTKRLPSRPTFNAPVRLEAISPRQGVLELVRRFQGGHRSALLHDEFGGSSTRLFMELADLVSPAQCYQLDVGALPEMADALSALVRKQG